MNRRIIPAALLTLVTLVSCGGSGPSEPSAKKTGSRFDQSFTDAKAYPVFASSEVVVGQNRFLVGLLDDNDAPIGSADIAMHIDFFDRAKSETKPVFGKDMKFIETIPGQRGLYVTTADFDTKGRWGAEVTVTGPGLDETVDASFDVAASGTTPAIGAPAPPSDTFTSDDVKSLSEISTDPHPDPDFYKLSIKDAIAAKEPFVVVFATPKFCTSQVCAPTLNIVKAASKDVHGVNFIHVEVYKNLDKPSNLVPVQAVRDWGLPSEPWVFVVDSKGKVAAKYEGTVGKQELERVLAKL